MLTNDEALVIAKIYSLKVGASAEERVILFKAHERIAEEAQRIMKRELEHAQAKID